MSVIRQTAPGDAGTKGSGSMARFGAEDQPTRDELLAAVEELNAQLTLDAQIIGELADQIEADRRCIDNYEIALTTARQIGMAMGIIMARTCCVADEAFSVHRLVSQRTHRKIRDIANDVVLTGTLPELPDPKRANCQLRRSD